MMNLYTEAMVIYTDIKKARIEEEEVGNTVNRLVVNLDKDIKTMVGEVFSDTKEMSPSVNLRGE